MSHLAGLRYRFYPRPEQVELFMRTFGCVRVVRNKMKDEMGRQWKEEGKTLSFGDMSSILTGWKKLPDLVWLNEVSCVPLQQTLVHLVDARGRFLAYRKQLKAGVKNLRKVGYPDYLRKRDAQSAEFTSSAFTWDGKDLRLAKCTEPLDIVWTQPLWGDPSTVTVTLETDGTWWVSLCVRVEPVKIEGGRDAVGLDLGLAHYATDDQGNKVDNPKPLRKAEKKLAKAQRALARKQKGGKNRERQRKVVAKLHARVRNVRMDFLHKLSTRLIAENQVICVETLKIESMKRNRKLAKSISDAAWGTFVRMLMYKAEWYGRKVVRISPWEPSSKKCSCCGHRLKELDLKVRVWTCPGCMTVHDRDVNAAINIRAAGLAVLAEEESSADACGAGVRRGRRKTPARSAQSGAEWLRRKQEGPTGIRRHLAVAA